MLRQQLKELLYSATKYVIVCSVIVTFVVLQFKNTKKELKEAAKHTLVFGAIGAALVLILLSFRKAEFQTDGSVLVKYNGSASEVVIPAGITEIGRLAFQDCDSITKITIPDGVYGIREGAFANCTNLQKVDIAQTVQWIEARAFAYDFKLESVSLPDELGGLSDELFYGCESLKSVNIGKKIEWIGNYVFYHCKGLERIILPENVGWIGDSSFSGCENLQTVSLPQCDLDMGINVFANCKSLKKIVVPENLRYINTGTFWNCTALESITLPENVTSIGDRSFYKCLSLKKCNFPGDLTYIGDEAFYGCESLLCISLPETRYTYASEKGYNRTVPAVNCWIGEECFAGCTRLSDVYIPEHVTLSSTAFLECSSLKKVEVAKTHFKYKVIGNVLYSIGENRLILYPAGLIQKKYTIPDSVRSIEKKAFSGNDHIQSVTVGTGLQTIGKGAFSGCEGLRAIKLNEKLKDISEESFMDCSSLEEINIPSECNIDVSALYGCTSLKSISVAHDNEYCQSRDGVLFDSKYQTLLLYPADKESERYEVPGSVKVISEYAFSGNPHLKEVELPDGVSQIERRAFSECKGLQRIFMTESVEIMASEIFYGIEDQVTLTINAGSQKCIPVIYAENVGITYEWVNTTE